MEDMQIGWLAILVAAILNQLIEFFWYSKWAFGPKWMKLEGIKEDKKGMGSKMGVSFINSLVIAFFLAFFVARLEIGMISDGILLGFFVWLGFVATAQLPSVIWCKRPFQLFLIDTGYKLLSLMIMGGIIAA